MPTKGDSQKHFAIRLQQGRKPLQLKMFAMHLADDYVCFVGVLSMELTNT